MAIETFDLWDSKLVEIGAGKPIAHPAAFTVVTLLDSGVINNQNNLPGCDITVTYEDITPNITAGFPQFGIICVIEDTDGAILASQFAQFRNLENTKQRVIRLDPGISDEVYGLDNSPFLAGLVLQQISPNAGRLRGDFRVRVIMVDNETDPARRLTSVRITAKGERHD